jgi:diketogulonate reductase-like aldo/keto reductase
VLPKSTDPARIEGNLDVLDWSLDEEDARALSELPTRRRMVDGSFWLSPLGPYKTLEDLWDGP